MIGSVEEASPHFACCVGGSISVPARVARFIAMGNQVGAKGAVLKVVCLKVTHGNLAQLERAIAMLI